MDILKALKDEESKLVKKAQAIRAAINSLGGNSSGVESNGRRKKRHVSAASRAKMAKSQRARWAKIKAAKRKADK
jgi:hypothetical protein